MPVHNLEEITTCVANQDRWRSSETLNMIASENSMSKTAMKTVQSDFHHRYAEGLVGHRAYQGQKFQDQIEQITIDLTKDVFHSDFAEVRAPTATIANLALYPPHKATLCLDAYSMPVQNQKME